MKGRFTFLLFYLGMNVFLSLNSLSSQSPSITGQLEWIVVKILDGGETPTGPLQEVNAIDLDSEGNMYLIDSGRNRLVKYSGSGNFLKEIGGFGRSADRFSDPRDLDAHLTLNIYVADFNNNRIVRLDKNLNYLNDFFLDNDSPYYFEFPVSVAVNNQYDLYILEDLNKRIIKMDRFSQPAGAFGSATENLGQLLGPCQLALGSKNELYVSDPLQKSVVVFDQLGNFLREIKHSDFIEPRGIFLTPQDQLLVADLKGRKLFFYGPGGRYLNVLDLQSLDIYPTDAAIWAPRGSQSELLYISSRERCFIFKKRDNE